MTIFYEFWITKQTIKILFFAWEFKLKKDTFIKQRLHLLSFHLTIEQNNCPNHWQPVAKLSTLLPMPLPDWTFTRTLINHVLFRVVVLTEKKPSTKPTVDQSRDKPSYSPPTARALLIGIACPPVSVEQWQTIDNHQTCAGGCFVINTTTRDGHHTYYSHLPPPWTTRQSRLAAMCQPRERAIRAFRKGKVLIMNKCLSYPRFSSLPFAGLHVPSEQRSRRATAFQRRQAGHEA